MMTVLYKDTAHNEIAVLPRKFDASNPYGGPQSLDGSGGRFLYFFIQNSRAEL